MQLTKTFLIFWVSLFPCFSGLYSVQAQTGTSETKKPKTSIQEPTERRTYVGQIPSLPTALPDAGNEVPGSTLCKTRKTNGVLQKEIEAQLGAQRIRLQVTNLKRDK